MAGRPTLKRSASGAPAAPPRRRAPAPAAPLALRAAVRRLASGEPVDWPALEDGGRSRLGGLQVVESIARAARSERRALEALAGSTAAGPPIPARPGRGRAAGPGSTPRPAAVDGSAAVPRRWGTLELRERIGAGSFGEVFRAHDPALSIDVALKLWFPRWSLEAGAESFLEEARMLARVRHPHVVTVHGAARHDGRVGMWTELLEGETLDDLLRERGLLGAAEAALIGIELCRALAAVHHAGLVHRDVTARNVMRVEGGRIVLMDFGAVTPAGPPVPGAAAGTPIAMAPEQLAGAAVDARADLYALGVLLYRLVSGRYPLEAGSLEELRALHARGERTPLRDRRADLPAAFVEVVERALDPDSARRPASAGALEQALLAFVRSTTDAPAPADAAPRRELPAPLTPLVGREREREECAALLGRVRLLTLTGMAGAGKSRLAIEVARRCAEARDAAAWVVDLAAAAGPELVAPALARALGAREEPGRPLVACIAERLGGRAAVLVLDHGEHVRAAAAEAAAALLAGCPALVIVAAGREPLGIAGEALYPVAALAVPVPGAGLEAVAQSEAVRLFVDGATLARPGFALTADNADAIAEICRRLDGLPLAIELAAARARMLSPAEILSRLDDRFRLLAAGGRAAPRHRTLLETLAWSYDLLAAEERALLRGLAVFAGGWTLEAAARVCGGAAADEYAVLDLLERLVDKSLVTVDSSARTTRYRMLETVRRFALDRLAAEGEAEALHARHLEQVADWSETRAPGLHGGGNDAAALEACDAEHQNVLAALASADRGDAGSPAAAERARQALRITGSFFPYWTHRALYTLGSDQVERALRRPGPAEPGPERARTTFAAALLAFYRGDHAQARRRGEESLEQFRALGIDQGVVWALNAVANARLLQGESQELVPLYVESLALSRRIGYAPGVAIALNNLANLAAEADDPAGALPLYRESVAVNREQGRTAALELGLANLAEVLVRLGRAGEAPEPLAEALAIAARTRRKDYASHAVGVAGLAAEALGADAPAARLLGAAEALRESIGVPLQPAERRVQEAAAARLRDRLGARWAEAREAGGALGLEAAIEAARAWVDSRWTSPVGGASESTVTPES